MMRNTFGGSHSKTHGVSSAVRCETAPTAGAPLGGARSSSVSSSHSKAAEPPVDEPLTPPYNGRMRRRGAVLQTGDAMMFPTTTDLVLPENSNIQVNYVFPPDDDRDVQSSFRNTTSANIGSLRNAERLLSPGGSSRAAAGGPQQSQQSLFPGTSVSKSAAKGQASSTKVGLTTTTTRRTDDAAGGTLVERQLSPQLDAFGDSIVPPLRQPEAIHSATTTAPNNEGNSPGIHRPRFVYDALADDRDASTSGANLRPAAPTTSMTNSCKEEGLPTPPPTPAALDNSAVTRAAAEIVCMRLQDDPERVPLPGRILEEGLDPVATGTPAGSSGDAVATYDAAFQTCLVFMSELAAAKRNGGALPNPMTQTTTSSSSNAPTNPGGVVRGKNHKQAADSSISSSSTTKRSSSQRKKTAQIDDSANQSSPKNDGSVSGGLHSDLVNDTERTLLLHFFDPEKMHNTLMQQWHTNHYDPAPATPHHVEQQRGRCASVAMEAEWRALAVKVLLAKCPSLKQQTASRKKSFRQLSQDELPPDETNEERGIRLLREEALLALDRAFHLESLLDDNAPELRTQQGKGPAIVHTVANSPLITISPVSYLDPIRGLHLYVWPSYAKAQYLYRVTQRVAEAMLLDTHVAGGVLRCPVMALYDICGLAVTVQPVPILEHGWSQSALRVPMGTLRQGDLSLLSFACSQLLWHVSCPARLFDVYATNQQDIVLYRGQEGYLYLVNPEATQDRGTAPADSSFPIGSPRGRNGAAKSKQHKDSDLATPLNTSNSTRPALSHLKRGALVSVPVAADSSESSPATAAPPPAGKLKDKLLTNVLGAFGLKGVVVDNDKLKRSTYMVGSTLLQALVFTPKFSFRGLCDAFQLSYRPQNDDSDASAAPHKKDASSGGASKEARLPTLGDRADITHQATAFFRYVAEVAVPQVAQQLMRECHAARAGVEQHFIYRHNTVEDKEEQTVIDMVRLGAFAQVMHEGNLPLEAAALVLRCLNSGQFGDDDDPAAAAEAATPSVGSPKALGGGTRRGSTKNLNAGVPTADSGIKWAKRSQRRLIEVRDTSDDEREEEMMMDRLARSASFSAGGGGNSSLNSSSGNHRGSAFNNMENSSSLTRKSSLSFSTSNGTTAPSASMSLSEVTSPLSTTTSRLKRVVAKIDEDASLRRIALRVVKTEMLGRAAKAVLRVHLATLGGPVSQHVHMQLLNRMRRLLHETASPESESFWKDTLLPLAKKKFHVTTTRDLAFVDRRHVPAAALAMRMMSINPFIDPATDQPPLRLHRLVDLETHLRGVPLKIKAATAGVGGTWMHTDASEDLSKATKQTLVMSTSDHNAVTTNTKEGPTLVRYCTKDSTQSGGFFGLVRPPTISVMFSVTPHVPYALTLLGCSTALPPRLASEARAAEPSSSTFDVILRQRQQLASLQRLGSVGRHAAWHSAYLLALRSHHAQALVNLTALFQEDTESLDEDIDAVKSDAVDILQVNGNASTATGPGGTKTIALTTGVHQQMKLSGHDTSDMETTFKQNVLRRVHDGSLFTDDLSTVVPSTLYRAIDLFDEGNDDSIDAPRDFFRNGIFGAKSCGHAEFSRCLGDSTLMLMSYDAERLRRLVIDIDSLRFGGVPLNHDEQSTAVVIHVMLQVTKAVAMLGMKEFEGNDPNAPPPPIATAVKPPAKGKGKKKAPNGKLPAKKFGATAANKPAAVTAAAEPAAADRAQHAAAVERLPMRVEGQNVDTTMTTPRGKADDPAAARNESRRVVAAVADTARDEDITKWSLTAFNLLIAEFLRAPEDIVDHVPMAHALIAIGDSLESRNMLQVTGFIRLLNEKFCAACRGTSRQDLIRRRSIALRALRSVTRQGKLLTAPEIFEGLVGLLDDAVYRTYASGVEDYESDVSIQALLMVIVLGCGKVFDAPRTQCVRRLLARLQSDNSRALVSLQDQLQSSVVGSMYWLFRRKDSLDLLHKVLNFMEKKKSDVIARARLKAFLDFHAKQLVCTEMIQRIGVSYRVRKTLYPKFLDFDRIRRERAIAASILAAQEGKIIEHDQKLQRDSGMKSEMAARLVGEQAEATQRDAIMKFFLDARPRDMFYPLLALDPTRHNTLATVQSTVLGMEPRPPSRAKNDVVPFRRPDDEHHHHHHRKIKEEMQMTITSPTKSSDVIDDADTLDDGDDGITPTPPNANLLAAGSMEDTWLEGFVLTKGERMDAQHMKRKKPTAKKKVSPYGRIAPLGSTTNAAASFGTSTDSTQRAPLYIAPPPKAATVSRGSHGARAGGGGTASGSLALTAPRVKIQPEVLHREEDDISVLLRSIFSFCDADNDGYITADAIILATDAMQLDYFVDELRMIFGVRERRFVNFKGGRLSFEMFQDAVMKGCGLF